MSVSIVIAAHNEGEALRRTIRSCVQSTPGLDYEIIVADDATTDGSVERALRGFPQLRLHRHKRRLGVSPTKAMGASKARGAVLIFLDGHTNPERGAIARLAEGVARTNGGGIITPAIATLDVKRWKNSQSRIGHGHALDLFTLDCDWPSLHDMRPASRAGRRFFESPALHGCAFAISRKLYDTLWGFDANMRFWGLEDLDLGLKCWLMGHRILHDPEVIIGHRFQQTLSRYSVPLEHVVANRLRMARKNFSHGVWTEWLEACRERNSGGSSGHAGGLWAHVWKLFNAGRASLERERAYLHAHCIRDEFWYAKRFGLEWPVPSSVALSSRGYGVPS